MYKVYFYMTGGNSVTSREFPNFGEAIKYSITLPLDSVLEIKYYPDEDNKRENRT